MDGLGHLMFGWDVNLGHLHYDVVRCRSPMPTAIASRWSGSTATLCRKHAQAHSQLPPAHVPNAARHSPSPSNVQRGLLLEHIHSYQTAQRDQQSSGHTLLTAVEESLLVDWIARQYNMNAPASPEESRDSEASARTGGAPKSAAVRQLPLSCCLASPPGPATTAHPPSTTPSSPTALTHSAGASTVDPVHARAVITRTRPPRHHPRWDQCHKRVPAAAGRGAAKGGAARRVAAGVVGRPRCR